MEECACDICNYNLDWRCGLNHSDFKEIETPDDCDDFELMEDYDDDDEDDEEDFPEVVDCPNCDSDAYWNGSEYECENCGYCFLLDDDDDDDYDE